MFNTTLVAFAPLTYDSAYNTASPAGSSTTTNWGGCVIEPTSSGENASGTGVLSVSGNPDTSEPTSGLSWYPLLLGEGYCEQLGEWDRVAAGHHDRDPGPR